jgi:hypothetical protein
MVVFGLILHLAVAFPLAFGAYAILGMLAKVPESGASFVYTVAGVCYVLSIAASCLCLYRRRTQEEAAPDADAFLLLARGLLRIWSGR